MTQPGDRVLLAHGSGGTMSHRLLAEVILPRFQQGPAGIQEDQFAFQVAGGRLAVTTDAYVVTPIFFPGGTIGELAIHGTINDLAVGGYEPLLLTLSLIIEEGFPMADLVRVLDAAAAAAREAGVPVVAGDTKVVNRGKADGLFVTTSGVGRLPDHVPEPLSAGNIRVGDRVIVSGTVGDHGLAVLTSREGLRFSTPIVSDTAALHGLASAIMRHAPAVHAMRDPTRGGLATTLVEMAGSSRVTIAIDEETIPVRPEVRGAAELLGIDPMYAANEGKLMAFVAPEAAEAVLEDMRRHPRGLEACLVGEVTGPSPAGSVVLRTAIGGSRLVGMLTGEQLPRIC